MIESRRATFAFASAELVFTLVGVRPSLAANRFDGWLTSLDLLSGFTITFPLLAEEPVEETPCPLPFWLFWLSPRDADFASSSSDERLTERAIESPLCPIASLCWVDLESLSSVMDSMGWNTAMAPR